MGERDRQAVDTMTHAERMAAASAVRRQMKHAAKERLLLRRKFGEGVDLAKPIEYAALLRSTYAKLGGDHARLFGLIEACPKGGEHQWRDVEQAPNRTAVLVDRVRCASCDQTPTKEPT